MSDPRLSSPSTFRLVAASAAAVASLAVVALGVQLGTRGLVGDGPGRNPGAASASPAAALVDAARPRTATEIPIDQLVSVVPAGGAFGSTVPAAIPSATPAPAAPASGGGGGGSAAPSDPGAVPPTTMPSVPGVTIPPAPTVPPELAPVLGPVLDTLDATAPSSSADSVLPDTSGATGTIEGVVKQLLGL